jgi:hypothetical protein
LHQHATRCNASEATRPPRRRRLAATHGRRAEDTGSFFLGACLQLRGLAHKYQPSFRFPSQLRLRTSEPPSRFRVSQGRLSAFAVSLRAGTSSSLTIPDRDSVKPRNSTFQLRMAVAPGRQYPDGCRLPILVSRTPTQQLPAPTNMVGIFSRSSSLSMSQRHMLVCGRVSTSIARP